MQEVKPKSEIIIPVWNLKDLTSRCIESIIKNTACLYRLIIIDNGSDKETKDYLESLKEDRRIKHYILLRNEENLGCTKAINQGLRLVEAEYAVVLNNDTVVCKGWLSELIKVANSSKDIGIVNPNSNNLGFKKPWYMSLDDYADMIMKKYRGKWIEMAAAVGFCSLIKKELIDKIGGYDEDFGMGNFDDTEYSIRARESGYKTVLAKGAYVYHKEHASFDLLGDFEKFFKDSEEIFYKKFKKPKRILYIFTKENPQYFKKLPQETRTLANKLNWIRVFKKTSLVLPKLAEHTNIQVIPISLFLFRIHCIFNILVKKKKYAEIFVDDKKIFYYLNKLRKYHRAKVNLG